MKRTLCLLALLGLWSVPAVAQPSATMRSGLLASFGADASFSSRETIARGAADLGEMEIVHFAFNLSDRHAWSESTVLNYGLAYSTHRLDATGAIPLPESLNEFSLNLGLQHRFSPRWSLAAFARPGLYGDFEDLDGDSFNLPVLLLANYTTSPELTWSFGLNANPFSDRPVLPVLGVRWQFAPDWTFNVGFPRSGVTWRMTEQLSWRAGVGFQGGSFRITENLGVPAPGIARLANTFVDFREIRVGVGGEWRWNETAALAFDVGAVTDRKFDYFDRGYRLDGDAGFFASVGINASF